MATIESGWEEPTRRTDAPPRASAVDLSRVHAVVEALSPVLSPAQVADVIVREGLAALDALGGGVAQLASDGGHFEVLRIVGFPDDALARWARFPTESPLPSGDVYRSRAPVFVASHDDWVARYGQPPRMAPIGWSVQDCSWAALPLLADERLVGVLTLCFPGGHAVDDEERAFMLTLARHCAQALERARAYEALRVSEDRLRRALDAEREARARTERLQAVTAALAGALTVSEVAAVVAAHGAAALDGPTGAVWTLDESDAVLRLVGAVGVPGAVLDRYDRLALDADLPIACIVRHGAPIFTRDHATLAADYPRIADDLARTEREAWAGLPLRIGERIVGCVAFGFVEPRTFSPDDEAFAAAIAQQGAQALERARLHEAERELRAEAERANRAKSDFLAVMSHELRTPLNAIGGYAELMELGIRGPVSDDQRADLRRIQQSQRHLLGLINQVLNYARVDAGTLDYQLEDVPLAEAVAAAEALVLPQARSRGLRVVSMTSPPTYAVRADRDKLRQILLNLLSNAVKFTAPGGMLCLECDTDGDTALVRVIDTGVGIAPGKLDAVFEPFVQVDQRLTRPHDGVGLGLAISRELARGMGGELTATSAEGVGSTFTLRVPLGG